MTDDLFNAETFELQAENERLREAAKLNMELMEIRRSNEAKIERLRGLSDITRLDVMWLLREYLASSLDRAPDLDKRASEALGE